MPNRKYYVISDDNCKFESMTKEEILTAIVQAIEGGEIGDVDTGFITTVKEQAKSRPLQFWLGTSAEYNAIVEKESNCFYVVTDDTEIDDIRTAIDDLSDAVEHQGETISSMDQTISELTEEVGNHAVSIENMTSKILLYDYTEGWVLIDQTVEYSDSVVVPFSFPQDEELPSIDIGTWKMVKVITSDNAEVICDVFERNNFYYIRGTSCGSSSQASHITLISINITCEADHTYANNSTSTTITSNGAISISQQAIKKIIGIGRM